MKKKQKKQNWNNQNKKDMIIQFVIISNNAFFKDNGNLKLSNGSIEGKINLDIFDFNKYPNFFPYKIFIHFWFFKPLLLNYLFQ